MRASLRELNTPTSTALAMMMIPSFRLVASVISALCPLLIGIKTALGELPKSVAAGPESIADSQGSVFYADPATGIVYRKVVHTTERAVAKTEVDFREEIVYRPQVVIETKPETRTLQEPVVTHFWKPRLTNRWNPFGPKSVYYEHTPETRWETRTVVVQSREPQTRWLTDRVRTAVPRPSMRIIREEVVGYEAVGRMPVQARPPAADPEIDNHPESIAARLKPIPPPQEGSGFIPGKLMPASGIPITPIAANGSRTEAHAGLRASELLPSDRIGGHRISAGAAMADSTGSGGWR